MGDGRGISGGSGGGGGGGNNRPAWLQQYDLIGKIGEGTYGLVFLAKTKLRKSCIAIKKFKQSKDGDGVSPTAIREIMVIFKTTIDDFRLSVCLWVVRRGHLKLNLEATEYFLPKLAKKNGVATAHDRRRHLVESNYQVEKNLCHSLGGVGM
ncbi:Cyclin-dependent kinase E-1 [Platanthera zijinensis]|uniref:Cyclin-dependent kinase E-1 n=1 Tax=Platanthera zijinensis TaxID=2320716 RepID=A0AAP0GFM0_9ASPA